MATKESGRRRYITALLFLLCLVPVVALYGRTLERSYPFLIIIIPSAGFFLFLLHATSAAIAVVRARKAPLGFLLVATPFLSLLISALLVDHPIERIHIVKYTLLTYLIAFAQGFGTTRQRLVRALLFGSLVGTAEETSQLWIPDRRFDPRDVLLNVISVGLGALYAALVFRASKQENPTAPQSHVQ